MLMSAFCWLCKIDFACMYMSPIRDTICMYTNRNLADLCPSQHNILKRGTREMDTIKIKLELPSISTSVAVAKATLFSLLQEFTTSTECIKNLGYVLSEAVMNCVNHAYPEENGKIYVSMTIRNNVLILSVRDTGIGIDDIQLACTPVFTTKAHSSGMGLTIMECLVDEFTIKSTSGRGTKVTIRKKLKNF